MIGEAGSALAADAPAVAGPKTEPALAESPDAASSGALGSPDVGAFIVIDTLAGCVIGTSGAAMGGAELKGAVSSAVAVAFFGVAVRDWLTETSPLDDVASVVVPSSASRPDKGENFGEDSLTRMAGGAVLAGAGGAGAGVAGRPAEAGSEGVDARIDLSSTTGETAPPALGSANRVAGA